MRCPICNKEVAIIDYPITELRRYHVEDTEWGIPPTDEDPGMLVAKSFALPASECKG